jgi:hypothetical protein
MELEEFINKAKQIAIEKRLQVNTKYEFLKDWHKLNLHEDYLRELEKMPAQGQDWNQKIIDWHKQQILKD